VLAGVRGGGLFEGGDHLPLDGGGQSLADVSSIGWQFAGNGRDFLDVAAH
jgi:hypothetical protein